MAAMVSRGQRWCWAGGVFMSLLIATAAQAEDATDATPNRLSEHLQFGGSIELAYEREQDFDLDSAEKDDADIMAMELTLEFLFEPNDFVEVFFQPQLIQQVRLREEGENEDRGTEFVIEEAYLKVKEPDLGLSLQVGRQNFEDDRQWIFDADLDGILGAYETENVLVQLSATRKALVDTDPLNPSEEEDVNNYILYGAVALAEDITLGAYGIVSDHRSGERDQPVFFGIQSFGTIADRLDYWADAAIVRGEEENRDIKGFGIDLLGAYHFDLPLSPYLILGYAFGSGDADPDDGTDTAFRQTGLQGNEVDVGGLTPLRYYGEAFDPELSNMSIFTAGLGARPIEGVSLDLLYHHYQQDEAFDELRDSALDAEPNGESRRLGDEIDLVLGYGEEESLKIRGFLGYFMPGRAFGSGADDALFARIEVIYEF
jgi:alginate production protein